MWPICFPFRDRWNIFDLTILLNFFCAIFPLRIVTWAVSESVTNNRALVVAGYLYGFNTMLLTIRAFWHLLETIKGVGTIQIALFHIIRDVVVVVVHFVAITLAFSSTITKVCMAEKSMVGETPSGKERYVRKKNMKNIMCCLCVLFCTLTKRSWTLFCENVFFIEWAFFSNQLLIIFSS